MEFLRFNLLRNEKSNFLFSFSFFYRATIKVLSEISLVSDAALKFLLPTPIRISFLRTKFQILEKIGNVHKLLHVAQF